MKSSALSWKGSEPASYRNNFIGFFWVIALMWVVEILDRVFFGQTLEWYGIHPRDWSHWCGIFTAPFLHGSWGHLMGNSVSLMILGAVILLRGWEHLVSASIYSALIAGGLVWLIGDARSVHIGASSVLFGYFGFLIGLGWYEKTFRSILIAVGVIFFYGGAAYTMLPSDHTRAGLISWEGHLGGALGGFFAAKIGVGRRRRK